MPYIHLLTLPRNLPGTTVPVLLDGGDVVQGSGRIMDYLDNRYPSRSLTPDNEKDRQACIEIEKVLGKKLGVSIRQIFYARLHSNFDYLYYCFTYSMPISKRIFFPLLFPLLRNKIHQFYVISDKHVDQGKRDFESAMNELETILKEQNYLVGEKFSRADVSIASMLSILVMPTQQPFPWKDIPDSETKAYFELFHDHPVTHWVRKMYEDQRLSE